MVAFREPWEEYQAPPQGAPQPLIARPPPQRTPQTPVEVDTDAANLERIRLANEAARATAAQGVAAQAAEAERKAASFLIRAVGSNQDYENWGVGPRSVPGQMAADVAPRVGYAAASGPRQAAESAQNEFIAATLRQDSGAAIPPTELETQREIYFPRPGAGPEAITQARRARWRAVAGLLNAAGRSAPPEMREAAERYLQAFDRRNDESAAGGQPQLAPITQPAQPTDPAPERPDGNVLFNDEARPPQPTTAPGGETFRGQLEAALNAGQFRNADEMFAFAERLNPAIVGRLSPQTRGEMASVLAQFQQARQRDPRARVEVALPMLPPDAADSPTVTDARGGRPAVEATVGIGGLSATVNSEQVDATVRGAADIGFGLADEIAAAGDTLFGRGGTYGENLWRQRGIDEYDRENNPGWRLGGQTAAAFAIPTSIGRATVSGMRGAVGSYGGRLDGPARQVAIWAGRRAGARRLGYEGAAYGGGYGFGSSEGDVGDRLTQGGLSALVAGPTAYGLGRTMGAVAGRYGRRGEDVSGADQLRAARSAAELDIPMPRSVIGGEQAQRWATTVEKTPFGAAPVARGTERMIDASGAARDRIAREAGEVMEPEALGDAGIRGGEAIRSRTSSAATRLYDEAERLTGETRVPLPGAAAELDGQIAELADTPGVVPEMLSTLQNIRSRLDGDWTPASVRRMKTQLERQFGEAGMRPSDASRRARLITEAAEEDMVTGLTNAGQADAAQGWRAAADNWRERQTMLRRVVEPILGRDNERTPEDVTRALLANARGNGTRLGAFLRELPAEEAGTIRASIINQLGRSPPGQQNAAGEAFSLDTFLTHWTQIKGARHQIFPRATVGALNHLANVAERARFAGRARNLSNTGTPMMVGATVTPVIAGAGAAFAGSPKLLAASIVMSSLMAVAQNRAGALLASPKFARRLASTIENPANARSIWSGPWVAQLARSEPSIANDLLGFQQAVLRQLGEAGSRSPALRAAAEEDDQVRREPVQ